MAWAPVARCVACTARGARSSAQTHVELLRESDTDSSPTVCQGARQGFALAFTGAIAALPCLSAKVALDTLHTHSEPVTGSAKVRRLHCTRDLRCRG